MVGDARSAFARQPSTVCSVELSMACARLLVRASAPACNEDRRTSRQQQRFRVRTCRL